MYSGTGHLFVYVQLQSPKAKAQPGKNQVCDTTHRENEEEEWDKFSLAPNHVFLSTLHLFETTPSD